MSNMKTLKMVFKFTTGIQPSEQYMKHCPEMLGVWLWHGLFMLATQAMLVSTNPCIVLSISWPGLVVTMMMVTGFIGHILNWRGWTPLGRVTYSAYLIHPLVIFIYAGNRRDLNHVDNFSIVSEHNSSTPCLFIKGIASWISFCCFYESHTAWKYF